MRWFIRIVEAIWTLFLCDLDFHLEHQIKKIQIFLSGRIQINDQFEQ